MKYIITCKINRTNSQAWLELEKVFRKRLKDFAIQQGAESIQVENIRLVDADDYEMRDARRIVDQEDLIERKYYEQKTTISSPKTGIPKEETQETPD